MTSCPHCLASAAEKAAWKSRAGRLLKQWEGQLPDRFVGEMNALGVELVHEFGPGEDRANDATRGTT